MKIRKNNVLVPALILAGILVVALTLRVWGIGFGLPYVYHFDEHFYVNTALHLGRGVLNNPPYNPTGLSNILFPQYAVYYLIGKLLGRFPSPVEFEAAYRFDPSVFFLLGRLTTAIFGAATALVLYLLGRATTDSRTGLISAALLSVSFLHVRDSHYAVPDIGMVFFAVLAVGLAVYSLKSGKRRDLYLACLSGGLAVAMKWTALPIVVPVFGAAVFGEYKRQNSLRRTLINRTIIYFGIFFTIGFILASPQMLINPTPYIRHVQGVQQAAQSQTDLPGETFLVGNERWLIYWNTLLYGMGGVLLALGLAGALRRLVLVVKERDPVSILILSFPLVYFPTIAIRGFYFARYLLPVIPFFALFAADFIVASRTMFLNSYGKRFGFILTALMIIASVAQPLAISVRHGEILVREDTRTLAKEWIESNIEEGSKIALDWPVHGPPLSTKERTVPYSEKVYDVHIIGGKGLFKHPQPWYEEQGFDYLITSTYISNNMGYGGGNPARRAFYDTLGERYTLVKEFRHYIGDTEPPFYFLDEIYGPTNSLWQRIRPGPTLKIYNIQQ